MKAKKPEIRKAEKAQTVLKLKKEENEAVKAATAQKVEIETVVTGIISSGKSADDILAHLK